MIVKVDKTEQGKRICLRDEWIDTPISVNAYVHVIGLFVNDCCIVDDKRNILILHPDQLISSTVVADSFSCTRRAVLQDRVKATSEPTAPLVYGSILHEIFQEVLIRNTWSDSFLDSVIERITKQHIEDLYSIKVDLDQARTYLKSKMGELQSWADTFITAKPKPHGIIEGRGGNKANMCVTKLLDVEEHVWSPMYGLKGNIDATVEVVVQEGKTERILTVPFEVKTGKKVSVSHQAQTALYNLLLSDRYDIDITYGILYYMETSQTKCIPAVRRELRQMIMQRNELACFLRERNVRLPEMKRNKQVCTRCFAQTSCFVYHRLADGGTGETSGMGVKFDEVVGHLNGIHQKFFLLWEELLTKEEKETQKLKRELWTMTGPEREKVGRCLSGMILDAKTDLRSDMNSAKDNIKINRHQYRFVKDNPDASFSFLDSQLAVGEPIVVSDEDGHFALALGFVVSVAKRAISVAVDRRLLNSRIRQPGFNERSKQVFGGIMEVVPREQTITPEVSVRYRIDKDEFNSGMATVRNNIVNIMADSPQGRRIRELVVDLRPPRFTAAASQYQISSPDILNGDQMRAIDKVMSARDYALVLGMPGTGKTTTIAHIIRALISQGKSVLLTSYTHTAVDNILLKLKRDCLPILRLGAPAKIHSEVQDFAILGSRKMDDFDAIRQAWIDTPIVATTCLGINHPLFHERNFDYCIVDEASQITLPVCIGPIRLADRFVLVGDHYQLPPVVQNEEARRGGLDVSLFKLLSDKHHQSVVNLEHQYRMCEDIMTLSNTLIYDGRLKCGTEDLRQAKLYVPNMSSLRKHHIEFNPTSLDTSVLMQACPGANPGRCWLVDLLNPEVRVRFINTDALGQTAREEAKGNRIINQAEAMLVIKLVSALLSIGIPAREIGIMTHYRSQLSLLKNTLTRKLGASTATSVEMHTADRFQGRDKEVVVLSLVRSNEANSIGELLRDWRRINVAFTRAKTKLLVVGSQQTLRNASTVKNDSGDVSFCQQPGPDGTMGGEEMVSRFVKMMEERSWVYNLPATALVDHVFEEAECLLSGSSVSPQKQPRPRLISQAAPVFQDFLATTRGSDTVPDISSQDDQGDGKSGSNRTHYISGMKRLKGKKLLINAELKQGKENMRSAAILGDNMNSSEAMLCPKKTARMSERLILKDKPILRDVLNDVSGGSY